MMKTEDVEKKLTEYQKTHGGFYTDDIARRWGVKEEIITRAAENLADKGVLLRGYDEGTRHLLLFSIVCSICGWGSSFLYVFDVHSVFILGPLFMLAGILFLIAAARRE